MNQSSKIILVRMADDFEGTIVHPRERVWPLALLSAATNLTLAGHETQIIDATVGQWTLDRLADDIVARNPDGVVIQMRPGHVESTRQLVTTLKNKMKAQIGLTGPYPSALPEYVIGDNIGADFCLRGEIDRSISKAFDYLSGGDSTCVPGLCRKTEDGFHIGDIVEEEDLDDLPIPDPSLLDQSMYKKLKAGRASLGRERWGFLLSCRGCPYRCEFCSPTMRHSFGHRFRAHSPEWIVSAMEKLNRDHQINSFSFEDDIFSYDKKRVMGICELLLRKNLGFKWIANTRADLVDPEMLSLMHQAGCCWISAGIESGSERILKWAKKAESREEIREGIKAIHEANIGTILNVIVGWPEESAAEIEETFLFAKQLAPMIVQIHHFTPYPGSPYYEVHFNESDPRISMHHYSEPKIACSKMPGVEIEDRCRAFYRRFYLSPTYFWRYLRHRGLAVANPAELLLIKDLVSYILARK